jgi:cytochrome c peroxidase
MQKLTLAALLAVVGATACAEPPPPPPPPKTEEKKPEPPKAFELDPAVLTAFGALPDAYGNVADLTPEKVELGRLLFHDKRLSVNGTQSCNSCHTLTTYGVDNQPTSTGAKGEKGGRNSPTVFGAAGHFVQFWDGRAADVEAQAKGPILNPVEMGMKDDKAVVATIKKVKGYEDKFKAAFPGDKDPITFDNYAKAVGAFERKLVTPSKWDAYLKGDKAALSEDEKKGAAAFVAAGCTACHSGVHLGGSMYQKLGLVKPWANTKDKGRGDLLKDPTQEMMFKVPSLRNIAKTAPYFHDGSAATLDDAVKLMAQHQLGKELSADELKSIVTFLNALTGTPPADLIAEPTAL